MNLSEIDHLRSEAPTAVSTPTAAEYARCDECGAPVDQDQRYCVNCGAHRRHVADPAARYLSRTTARSRAAAAGGDRAATEGRRIPGVVVAVMLALIPVTVAIGVVVGRSSNNNDAQLIRELSASQAQLAAAARAAGTTPSVSSTPAASGASASHRRSAKHASSPKAQSSASSGSNAAKAPSTINGPASTAQQQQGAAIVNKLQHTNGTNYLNQLPSQVVVP